MMTLAKASLEPMWLVATTSTVTQFHMGVEKFSILGGLCSCGQVPSAHPGPHEPNGMRAVSKALQAQSITRLEPHLIRQAGGIWRSCMKERKSISIMKKNVDAWYLCL